MYSRMEMLATPTGWVGGPVVTGPVVVRPVVDAEVKDMLEGEGGV
jgi:hypothetical protein